MTRNYAISVVRGLATVMVVALHLFQKFSYHQSELSVISDWLNLGLVLFFVISAFLYSQKNIEWGNGKWFVLRYLELIVPSVITVFFVILAFLLVGIYVTQEQIFHAYMSGLGFESFVPGNWIFQQLWFLTYILFFYLTLPAIQNIKLKSLHYREFILFLIFISVGVQILCFLASNVLRLNFFSAGVLLRVYIPYFIFRRYEITSAECSKLMRLLLFVSIPLIIIACYMRYGFSEVSVPASILELLFIYTQTLAGIPLFYYLYIMLQRVQLPLKLLKISDRYSYYVYLTHCIFIGYSTSVIDQIGNKVLAVLVVLALTIVSSVTLEKISTPLKQLIKEKWFK